MLNSNPRSANRGLAVRLLGLTVLMFGFGYALVPLYNVFCEIAGLNGKTGELTEAEAQAMQPDESRLVKVEFVTNVNAAMPWRFRPLVTSVEVHPGVATEVAFEAVNKAHEVVIGQAVPSVAPNDAARYFNKTECFCFTQQALAPGETKQMPVRFIVDPKLPAHIRTLTLGYTFFVAPDNAAAREQTLGMRPSS